MRRGLLILAIGAVLVFVGFILIAFTAASIAQEAEDNEFFLGAITLDPLAERSMDFPVNNASRPFYVIVSRVNENQLMSLPVQVRGQVVDPLGKAVASSPDVIENMLKVKSTITGTHRLQLTNMHTEEGITVMFTCTYGSIPTTPEGTIALTGNAVISVSLFTIGIPTLAVGAVIFVMDWRKSKGSNKTISP